MNAVPIYEGLLDEQALARLRELDPDGRHGVIKRVLTAFEASAVRLLADMDGACRRGDHGPVGAAAHTLKSSSASIGALALAEQCRIVEAAVRNGQVEQLVTMVDELRREGQSALVAVRAMLLA
ncbi:MAG: Hpt domain-containing protein [Rubrivivax sp.]|nr:Hpt domain-containing protein [Rubrivivax sp.]